MDGMTLVRVIPGNGLILYELDLGSLLFLLVVVNASKHKVSPLRQSRNLHLRWTDEDIDAALC